MDTVVVFSPAPGPRFLDNFNRADETLESSSNYTNITGSLSVASNRLTVTDPSTTTDGQYYVDAAEAQIADGTFEFDVIFDDTVDQSVNLYPRFTDANNHVAYVLTSDGNSYWEELNGGSFTELAAGTETLNSTGVANSVVITTSGTSLSATVNGGSALATTSSVAQTETQTAIRMEDDATGGVEVYIDNLSIS